MKVSLTMVASFLLGIMGCFSSPVEPDWYALSEGAQVISDENNQDSDAGNRGTQGADVEVVEDNQDKADVAVEDSSSNDILPQPFDTETGDGVVVDALETDADSESPRACSYPDDVSPCDLVGETRCVEDQPKKQEICVPGDGCPYWSEQFCEASQVCEDSVCQCENTCPNDGTCGQDDGCTGVCGCAEGESCESGFCECIPSCPDEGSSCGLDDGCGGTCPDLCIPSDDEITPEEVCVKTLACITITGSDGSVKSCKKVDTKDGDNCFLDGVEGVCAEGSCDLAN